MFVFCGSSDGVVFWPVVCDLVFPDHTQLLYITMFMNSPVGIYNSCEFDVACLCATKTSLAGPYFVTFIDFTDYRYDVLSNCEKITMQFNLVSKVIRTCIIVVCQTN